MVLVAGVFITCSVHANNTAPEYGNQQDSIAIYNTLIFKADSCYMKQNFELASKFFDKAFSLGIKPVDKHLYNGACAAALNGDESAAFNRLFERVRLYPHWYSDQIGQDKDLQSLHTSPKWEILCDTLQARKIFIERNYDHALKERLLNPLSGPNAATCLYCSVASCSTGHTVDKNTPCGNATE